MADRTRLDSAIGATVEQRREMLAPQAPTVAPATRSGPTYRTASCAVREGGRAGVIPDVCAAGRRRYQAWPGGLVASHGPGGRRGR
jgi:hypothetical protein